jgi:hypothetical protein
MIMLGLLHLCPVLCIKAPCDLLQAYPTHNSVSLSEVNRRIQTVVDHDAAAALHSQGSASSPARLANLLQPRSQFPVIRVDHSDTSSQYNHSFASQPRFR